MKTSKRVNRPMLDDVDRGSPPPSAVNTLIRLMVHEDHDVVAKAALAIGDVGCLAARPLAAAIFQAESPYHRTMMVVLLREVGSAFDIEVIVALIQVMISDPSEKVRALAAETLRILGERSLKLRKSLQPRRLASSRAGPGCPAR